MESANGQSTGLGGVGWGADALSEAPGHLAKPTSPFLCRSLLSSTLAPGTRPPSPPSDSHPPGGCQLTPLLSDWGAFKAQLDPAIPPHTHAHTAFTFSISNPGHPAHRTGAQWGSNFSPDRDSGICSQKFPIPGRAAYHPAALHWDLRQVAEV